MTDEKSDKPKPKLDLTNAISPSELRRLKDRLAAAEFQDGLVVIRAEHLRTLLELWEDSPWVQHRC